MLNNAEKVFFLEREIDKAVGEYCGCRNDRMALNMRLNIDAMLEELRSVIISSMEEEEVFDRLFCEIEEVCVA